MNGIHGKRTDTKDCTKCASRFASRPRREEIYLMLLSIIVSCIKNRAQRLILETESRDGRTRGAPQT